MPDLWQTEARKMGGDALVGFLEELRDDNRKVIEELEKFNRAFPDGDPDAHRRYHESVMEWRELRNALVRAALEKMASAGALAAVGWLVYAIWTAAKMEVQK